MLIYTIWGIGPASRRGGGEGAEGQCNPLPCFSPSPKKRGRPHWCRASRRVPNHCLVVVVGIAGTGAWPPLLFPFLLLLLLGGGAGSRGPQQPVSHREGGGGGSVGLCPDSQRSIKEGETPNEPKNSSPAPLEVCSEHRGFVGLLQQVPAAAAPPKIIFGLWAPPKDSPWVGCQRHPAAPARPAAPRHHPMSAEELRPWALDPGTRLAAVPGRDPKNQQLPQGAPWGQAGFLQSSPETPQISSPLLSSLFPQILFPSSLFFPLCSIPQLKRFPGHLQTSLWEDASPGSAGFVFKNNPSKYFPLEKYTRKQRGSRQWF